MAAGLGALHDEDVDTGRDLAQRMFLGADKGCDGTPCLRPISIIAFGGTPSALAISFMGCLKETSSNSIARCASNGCGWLSATLVVVSSMPYFFSRFLVKARCSGEIRASRLSR